VEPGPPALCPITDLVELPRCGATERQSFIGVELAPSPPVSAPRAITSFIDGWRPPSPLAEGPGAMPSTGEWNTEVFTGRLTPVGAPANGTDDLPVIDWGLPLTACGFEVDGAEESPATLGRPLLEPPPRAGISRSMSAGWEMESSAVSADSNPAPAPRLDTECTPASARTVTSLNSGESPPLLPGVHNSDPSLAATPGAERSPGGTSSGSSSASRGGVEATRSTLAASSLWCTVGFELVDGWCSAGAASAVATHGRDGTTDAFEGR
jgi:hypothetical protein